MTIVKDIEPDIANENYLRYGVGDKVTLRPSPTQYKNNQHVYLPPVKARIVKIMPHSLYGDLSPEYKVDINILMVGDPICGKSQLLRVVMICLIWNKTLKHIEGSTAQAERETQESNVIRGNRMGSRFKRNLVENEYGHFQQHQSLMIEEILFDMMMVIKAQRLVYHHKY